LTWYKFINTEQKHNGAPKTNYTYYTLTPGQTGSYVDQNVQYLSEAEFKKLGIQPFSTGIENGPVTYTGLAMLHGSP
jgi:hypothetical protein